MRHTLHFKIRKEWYTFTYNESDPIVTDLDRLLRVYTHVGDLRNTTTYIGEDPFERYNSMVSKLKDIVAEWIVEELKVQQLSGIKEN